jgi:MFS family permease
MATELLQAGGADVRAQAPADGEAAPLPVPRQWYLVVALMVLGLLAAIDRHCLAVLAPAIKKDLMLSDTQLSILLGLSFALFNTLTAIPMGWLVDRFSRKLIVGAGAVLWGMTTAIGGLSTTFVHLFWGRAGVGFAEAGLGPAAFSLIRDGVGVERRGRAFSVYGLSNALGNGAAFMVVGLLLGALAHKSIVLPIVGELRPWQAVLVTLGLVSLPFALLTIPIQEPSRVPSRDPFLGGYAKALSYMGQNRGLFVPIILFSASIHMTAMAFIAWMPSVAVRNFDISLQQAGVTMGLLAMICMPLGVLLSGVLIDVLRHRGVRDAPVWVGLGGLLTTAIPTVACTLMPTTTTYWSMTLLSLLTIATLYQIANNLLAAITPKLAAGRVIAIYTLGFTVLASLGPLAVGMLSDSVFGTSGPRGLGYAVSAAVALFLSFSLVALLWVSKGLKAFHARRADAP